MNYYSFTNFGHTFIRTLESRRNGNVRHEKVEEASALEQESHYRVA